MTSQWASLVGSEGSTLLNKLLYLRYNECRYAINASHIPGLGTDGV